MKVFNVGNTDLTVKKNILWNPAGPRIDSVAFVTIPRSGDGLTTYPYNILVESGYFTLQMRE